MKPEYFLATGVLVIVGLVYLMGKAGAAIGAVETGAQSGWDIGWSAAGDSTP